MTGVYRRRFDYRVRLRSPFLLRGLSVQEMVAAAFDGRTEWIPDRPSQLHLYPVSMAAPEFARYIPDVVTDTEACTVRRPERDLMCLRRPAEDVLALRRAPECPEELACSNQGCV